MMTTTTGPLYMYNSNTFQTVLNLTETTKAIDDDVLVVAFIFDTTFILSFRVMHLC